MAGISRRRFLASSAAAGVVLKVSFLTPMPGARGQLLENFVPTSAAWLTPEGKPRYRLDALAKVTGAKAFSRDFRARDMAGWPDAQSHAFLIRATKADHAFDGIDLSVLGADLKPDRVVLHEDLQADRITVPEPDFYGDWFLVPQGQTPRLLGQPVALLIYKDFARCDAAKRLIRFNPNVVRYGKQTGYNYPRHYGAARFVRIDGGSPDADDVYSPYKDAVIFGKFSGDNVVWPAVKGIAGPRRGLAAANRRSRRGQAQAVLAGDAVSRGMQAAARIAQETADAGDDALVLTRRYFSQSIDPSAMEADNGNVWYDPSSKVLHMIVATQSPHDLAQSAAQIVSRSTYQLKQVDLKVGYTVGYGSKDHHVFPLFCVVAGLYGDGRPVRLANDRFEQFQMGLKRHAFWMDKTLVVDRASGKFRALTGQYRADGGGRPNYSFSVGTVGTTGAQSIYYLPKSDLSVAVFASPAVEAGSMRGYGTLQTMSAMEMLVDEAAELLGIDPIELRLRNLLRSGMKNTQGAIPGAAVRNEEILLKAKAHPLWEKRQANKVSFEAANPGKKYGVGYAHVQKDYGDGADAAIASVEIDPKGRVTLRQAVHEIGTGATTSQALMVGDILGRVPDETEYAVLRWPQMPLRSTDQPYTTSQAEEDRNKKDPYWTPHFIAPTSASNSSYFFGHATREAARALVDFAIWPAAKSLWSRGFGGGPLASSAVNRGQLRLAGGQVNAGGLPTLTLDQVAAEAHRLGLVTGVTVHTFNRWQWAEAVFDVPEAGRVRLPIDALAVRYGQGAPAKLKAQMTSGGWHFVKRSAVFYPPVQRNNASVTYYAPAAALAEVAVDTATGEVRLLSHHMIIECGRQIVPELVSGQLQGGPAMGIGHALKESLPLYEGGPGEGTWNWNRYQLPRAKDVAVWTQTGEVLPPLSDTDPPKGIAEVVMIPIVPAIANAVAHAIGERFYELPITPDKVLKAL